MPTALQRTVAGLPAWVWGAALGGGLIVGLYLRRRSQAATAAAAGTDTAGATDGTQTDATGSDMSGVASGDTADPGQTLGNLPGQPYDGFGGGGPPAPPAATARIDPALLKVLRRLAREEAARNDREKKHTKRRRKPQGRPVAARSAGVPAHAMAGSGPGAVAPRTTADHYPRGTTSGVVQ